MLVVCVAATDPQGLPLTITYNYGDGTIDTLGKHAYAAAGVYPITVTLSDGMGSATATLSVTITEVANLWIKKQAIKVGAPGKETWQAQYIYNADRTLANIFNPATDTFAASLGTLPLIQITGSGTGAGAHFSGPKYKLGFKSVKGAAPFVSVSVDESSQTVTISAKAETFPDKVPGIFHNTLQLGSTGFFVDEALDAKGSFTANSGYRSTAFVVSAATVKVGKAGKDSAMFSMLLGDPGFAFPGASSAKTVRVRVTNVVNQIVIDKDLTAIVTAKAGQLKSGKDSTAPTAKFSYDSKKGKLNFALTKATLKTLLVTSEENVRVDVTLGDQTYTTHVTLFAAKSGSYNTKIPKTFVNFTPGRVTDTTAPTVVSTAPVNLTKNVAPGTLITATFSEPMNPATLTTANFTLQQGTSVVAGSVTYTDNTATFTPTGPLALGTTFTATVTTGATDLSGNALVCNNVWTFTTVAAPTVNSTIPANSATGIAFNAKISAAFSKAMDPATITGTTFTLMQGAAPVTGTVTYTASGSTATFTPAANLASSTVYTATITTGVKDTAGYALASNYIWSFTTGASADTTPPTVISTIPANAAAGVAVNSKVSATFSEGMDSLTINTGTFTLMQGAAPVAGSVMYAAVSNTATFTPSASLAPNTTFTATVTNGAKDLAGNALLANYSWTFTTSAAADTTPPNVVATNPADLAINVSTNHTVNATFDKAMDPATIDTLSFTLTDPGQNKVTGTVSYDAANKIATFTSSSILASNTQYNAAISTGVKDLAGNALAANKVWSFTTSAQQTPMPPPLGAATPYGTFGGGAGMTSQGLLTVINGDIGTTGKSTTVTGFHDSTGDIYTETPLNMGQVNGRIYTGPPAPGGAGTGGTAATLAVATQAASDANDAYNRLAAIPGGIDPGAGQLGGLTLAPGVYKAASGSFMITGSDLTLDAQGDANAVWVFQMATSLTVGGPAAPRSIILTNGAQAKNVSWQVGSAATINAAGGGTMVGTIIASAGITFSTSGNVTVVTLNGRAIGLHASTTLVNTVINVPAP